MLLEGKVNNLVKMTRGNNGIDARRPHVFLSLHGVVVIQAIRGDEDAARGHQPEIVRTQATVSWNFRHDEILLTVERHLHRIVNASHYEYPSRTLSFKL